MVKLDLDTVSTVPAAPPAADPDLALGLTLPGANCLEVGAREADVVVAVEWVPAVALTMP
jgi:hypothetical protein